MKILEKFFIKKLEKKLIKYKIEKKDVKEIEELEKKLNMYKKYA